MDASRTQKLIPAVLEAAAYIAERLDIHARLRLWDGSVAPLGAHAESAPFIVLSCPGVVASLLRRPTLDRFIRHYAQGDVAIEGGTIIDVAERLGADLEERFEALNKAHLARILAPFLFVKAGYPPQARAFRSRKFWPFRWRRDDEGYVRFHYDVGNAFYRLFLDERMVYSCAYFKDWDTPLDKAQEDKLDHICRKLRLRAGETFLDIGCGWGALLIHAASRYGVVAHGVTLSENQLEAARHAIEQAGLGARVTVEGRDYRALDGRFDKIASVGMYEHVGVANIPAYLEHVRRLLADDGLFLNHAIARPNRRKLKPFGSSPEQKALARYIFPGGELDTLGSTLLEFEAAGFEPHDVEGMRWHYALTTRHWCERLHARRAQAAAIAGEPLTRIWLGYLGGCSLAFQRGWAGIYQVLASRKRIGRPPVPPSRADLYA
jgi:cyclopropane-fatty-acyl-phospholipid synthase